MALPRSPRPFDRDVLEAPSTRGAPAGRGVALLDARRPRRANAARSTRRCPGRRSRSSPRRGRRWWPWIAGSSRSTTRPGRPGSTVRHLLAHASGLAFDDATVVSAAGAGRGSTPTPGSTCSARRSWPRPGGRSATSLRRLAPRAARDDRVAARRAAPRRGSSGRCATSRRSAASCSCPRCCPPGSSAAARRGRVPRACAASSRASGSRTPTTGGSGFEIRGRKSPHWTGQRQLAARRSGTSGGAARSCGSTRSPGSRSSCLTDRPFGAWAGEAWPALLGRGARGGSLASRRRPLPAPAARLALDRSDDRAP